MFSPSIYKRLITSSDYRGFFNLIINSKPFYSQAVHLLQTAFLKLISR